MDGISRERTDRGGTITGPADAGLRWTSGEAAIIVRAAAIGKFKEESFRIGRAGAQADTAAPHAIERRRSIP